MPNHVHLLVSGPQEGTVANIIQSLKIASAKRIKTSAEPAHSSLGQTRYYDRNMRDNKEFFEALKYIHRNPVRRGLVEKPEDWPWSSYRHYAFDEQGLVTVESQWAAYKRKHPSAEPNELSRIFAEQ